MPRRAPSPDLDQALADALKGHRDAGASPELDATTELLSTRGLRNWTVDDVAQRSGTARATLYRRYGSRDGLIQLAVTREARRFFQEIAAEVTSHPASLTDMVVNGMSTGLRLARSSALGELIERDPSTAMALIGHTKLLDAATHALTDLYLTMTSDGDRLRARARAEALVRLAISFLLVPGTLDHGDAGGAGQRLHDMVAPLVSPGRFQPAEHLLQNW